VYVEGIRRPQELLAAIDMVRAAGKPIVLLKAGRSRRARRNVLAHSGMLAPDDEVFRAVLRRHDVTLVDDLDELVETALLFAAASGRPYRRPYVMSNSGGEASVLLDVAAAVGLELSEPPGELVGRLQARFPTFAYVGHPGN